MINTLLVLSSIFTRRRFMAPNYKVLYIVLLAVLRTVDANIIFTHVPLSCDPHLPSYTGCLRGQSCLDDGSYVSHRGSLYEERDSLITM